jgi:protein O-GlcNAc transferase
MSILRSLLARLGGSRIAADQAAVTRVHAAEDMAEADALAREARFSEAAEHYRKVLDVHPDLSTAHNRLANCYNQLGRMADARRHYLEACRIEPDFAPAWASALACLNYDPYATPEQVTEAHRNWAERAAAPFYPAAASYDNDRDARRRLRIGYVSPDFRRHPVTAIFAPVLEAHERSAVEVFCYYNFASEDTVTLRLKRSAGHWRDVAGMDDEALCKQVRADGIDILVDLAGQTSGNRLLTFARKPAPVQVSWLGYFNTTGLATMDYFISDPGSSPPGQERFHVETLLRLPHSRFCYEPPDYMPEVGPLPALKNGHVTFASLHNLSKLNDKVLALWGKVMQAAPDARLLVKAVALDDAANRVHFGARCARHGIAPDRLDLRGGSPIEEVPATYAEVDIQLDCFPFSGGLTSFESLWLGVPVITLAGTTIPSRQSASILGNLGLTGLVTADEDAYVGKAAQLAGNLPQLAELRASLRPLFAASPLVDYTGMARGLEGIYRETWQDWLAATR